MSVWEPTSWWRVTLSDGSIWAESSDEDECRREHARITTTAVRTYADLSLTEGKLTGPDPSARLERLFARNTSMWVVQS